MSSDEEMPPQGQMPDMDDMSDDEEIGAPSGDGPLPDGIKKEILNEALPENWRTPKKGDEVSVHYVGTLESDGTQFDSSRSRGEPFTFSLGKGQVIKGWDLGVATMKKGELAKFTISSEFAYGDSGSPPTIPANATLVFEVELLSWASKDDLFGDEGVIKSLVKEGSGWKTPKPGDEVLLSLEVTKEDGSTIAQKTELEYTIGSGSLAACAKACDKALQGMKKGEESTLKCSGEYADDLDGVALVTLNLKEIFESKDVSFSNNKTIMKKQVKDGENYTTANLGTKCKLHVESATDGNAPLANFTAKTLEFTAGNGEVCDALEFAVSEMKKGERAVLTVTTPKLAEEKQLGLQNLTSEKVVLTMELQNFEKDKETYEMSSEEKIQYCQARKDAAAALFKSGRLEMALLSYKKVVDTFNYIDSIKEEDLKSKAKELKKLCNLNKAACYLKLEDYVEAKNACNKVIEDDSLNVKALYRRAQAEHGLKNFDVCMQQCKRVLEVDPKNIDSRELHKKAHLCQKEVDKKSKGLFANMCKALGKGPIPEPYKAKKPHDDMGDDSSGEDEAMDDDVEPEAKDTEMAAAESTPADAGA